RRCERRRFGATPGQGTGSSYRPRNRTRAPGRRPGRSGLRGLVRRRHAAGADSSAQARCARQGRGLCARCHRRRHRGRGMGGTRGARPACPERIVDPVDRETARPGMKLLVGTRSPGKTREIRELFAGLPFDLAFPADRLLAPLPEEADLERAMSYAENAVAKARYYATRAGLPAVADDSGIEVEYIGGAPGPRSARWAGASGDVDAANNALLLEQLAGVPPESRGARYRCVVAFLATPSNVPEIVEATCEGFILTEP